MCGLQIVVSGCKLVVVLGLASLLHADMVHGILKATAPALKKYKVLMLSGFFPTSIPAAANAPRPFLYREQVCTSSLPVHMCLYSYLLVKVSVPAYLRE